MKTSLPFAQCARPYIAQHRARLRGHGSGVAWAQTRINPTGVGVSGSVIGDDVLTASAAAAPSMGGAGNMQSIGVGIGWNSNLICGDMSITTTLQNQLNGITNGFQQIMSNVIQSATSAVASLPALIIQRADPGLYNLLTNGVLQARLDFDRSKMTCKAMANRMADMAGGQAGGSARRRLRAARCGEQHRCRVAVEQAESNKGNNGVPWVGGSNAGGSGQGSIKVVGDVTRAGYNLPTAAASRTPRPSRAHPAANRLTCQTWSSPQAAADFAPRARRARATHLRDLHQDADDARRRPDAGDPGRVRPSCRRCRAS